MSAVIGILTYAAEVGHWRETWIERRKRMKENQDVFVSGDARYSIGDFTPGLDGPPKVDVYIHGPSVQYN